MSAGPTTGATIEVTRPTTNAAVLARGLGRAASGRAKVAGPLPDVVLVSPVRADADTLATYVQLVGEEVRDALAAHVDAVARRTGIPLPTDGPDEVGAAS